MSSTINETFFPMDLTEPHTNGPGDDSDTQDNDIIDENINKDADLAEVLNKIRHIFIHVYICSIFKVYFAIFLSA